MRLSKVSFANKTQQQSIQQSNATLPSSTLPINNITTINSTAINSITTNIESPTSTHTINSTNNTSTPRPRSYSHSQARNVNHNEMDISSSSPEKQQHYLYLKGFRVEQCQLFIQHKCTNHKPYTCFDWHFQNQRRRRPVRRRDGTFNYSSDTYCTKYDETTGLCSDKDECQFLHRTAGDTERRYHLRYYKTGICVYDTDSRGHCVKNGKHCAFAHGAQDIRQPVFDVRELLVNENGHSSMGGGGCGLGICGNGDQSSANAAAALLSNSGSSNIDRERNALLEDPRWNDTAYVLASYKTVECKRPPRFCRQGYACPQYHNGKDRRRSPKTHKYRSTPCPNTKQGDEWMDPSNCEQGDSCPYCHSRTEQQFHPEIFKSTKCKDIQDSGYCPRGAFCAFAHNEKEMVSTRDIDLDSIDRSTSSARNDSNNSDVNDSAISSIEHLRRTSMSHQTPTDLFKGSPPSNNFGLSSDDPFKLSPEIVSSSLSDTYLDLSNLGLLHVNFADGTDDATTLASSILSNSTESPSISTNPLGPIARPRSYSHSANYNIPSRNTYKLNNTEAIQNSLPNTYLDLANKMRLSKVSFADETQEQQQAQQPSSNSTLPFSTLPIINNTSIESPPLISTTNVLGPIGARPRSYSHSNNFSISSRNPLINSSNNNNSKLNNTGPAEAIPNPLANNYLSLADRLRLLKVSFAYEAAASLASPGVANHNILSNNLASTLPNAFIESPNTISTASSSTLEPIGARPRSYSHSQSRPISLNELDQFSSNIEKQQHYLYLKGFRVEQCQLFIQHKCTNHKPYTCFDWHFQNQRRRRPVRRRDGTFNYSSDTYCTKYDETTGLCSDKDECQFLHRTAGDTERRYHLRYYKTGICVYDTDSRGHCVKNGKHCAFAHGAQDIRQPVFDVRELLVNENGHSSMGGGGCGLGICGNGDQSSANAAAALLSNSGSSNIDRERNALLEDPRWNDTAYVLASYKTVECKRPPRFCRQGYACPQYHNGKDRRRSPKTHKYRSTPCPNTKQGDEWMDPSNCEQGDSCPYCHSRTEQQFHPEIFKSTKCKDIQDSGYCPRGAFCAFAHNEEEMVATRDIDLDTIDTTSMSTSTRNSNDSTSTENMLDVATTSLENLRRASISQLAKLSKATPPQSNNFGLLSGGGDPFKLSAAAAAAAAAAANIVSTSLPETFLDLSNLGSLQVYFDGNDDTKRNAFV